MKYTNRIIDSGVYTSDGCTINDVLDQLPSSIDKKDISFKDISCESRIEYDGGGCTGIEFTVNFPGIDAVSKDTIRKRLSQIDDKYILGLQLKLGVLIEDSNMSGVYFSAPFKFYVDYGAREICGEDASDDSDDDDSDDEDDEHNIKNIIGGRGYFTPEQFHEEVDKILEIQKLERAKLI